MELNELNEIRKSFIKLPEDIKNIPWKFDCSGNVLCQDTKICDCQGSMEIARFMVTVHNQFLKDMEEMIKHVENILDDAFSSSPR